MNMKNYESYLIYDKPIPYKELFIHPILISDYLNFHIAVNCLCIEKNKIPDPNIIRMSYLDFLFYLIENDENGEIYSKMLIEIFRLCFKLENKNVEYIRDANNKINLIFKTEYVYIENSEKKTGFKDFIIDRKDFDNIKNIILYQNIPDYDDTYIDPKVEKVLKETQDFINKNKKKMCSFEDQLICVMLALQEIDKDKIMNLTIRKFSKIIERYDYKLHYEIYKQAELGGMVSFKTEIDHWMSELKKNKYSDVSETAIEYKELENKIKSV